MFTAAIDSFKRFFMQKTCHSVIVRKLFHHFHCKLVMVVCNICVGVYRGKFMLCGGDFIMFGLCKNTKFPKFLIKFFHEFLDAWLN